MHLCPFCNRRTINVLDDDDDDGVCVCVCVCMCVLLTAVHGDIMNRYDSIRQNSLY